MVGFVMVVGVLVLGLLLKAQVRKHREPNPREWTVDEILKREG